MSRYNLRIPVVLGFILLATITVLAQAPFTLEQVLSSPFPTGLVAAEHGSRVAWIFDAKGVRNVWVADGPDFAKTARQITHYNADDGQPIASLRLTADGKTALYALGSELNGAQESANPASWTKGAKQQVFAIDIDTKDAAPRLLGEMGCPEEGCEDIAISPDGKWAVWSAKKKLWLASVDGKQQAKELATVRGAADQPKWSPDSKQIAFVSERDTHSFVTLYEFDRDSIRYLSPSVDKDNMPRWSLDGKSIVFVRTAGTENKQPLIPVRPEPWSIWVADAATGKGHVLWRSGTKLDDSLPQLTEDASLNIAADGRIVFASEQDGRNHLYSIPATGGTATLLTPGDFDVEDVTLSTDKASVIYSSNQDDVDRRHLWRVPVAGGAPPQALTHGDTMEWAPVQTGNGKNILCLGSTATVPAMPYVVTADGREMIAKQALPSDFPSASLVTPKQVIFKSADGLTIHGQLFVPRNLTGKVPGLVFTHGGPIRQMMLGFHYMDYYHNAYAMNQYSGEPRIRSVIGELPSRRDVWTRVSHRAQYRLARGCRIPGRRRRGTLLAVSSRGRCREAWLVGRFVRRLLDRNGPGAQLRPVQGRSGFPRRARLERLPHPTSLFRQSGNAAARRRRCREAGMGILARRIHQHMEITGAPHSGRRRSQRAVQPDRRPRAAFARAERLIRATGSARRNPRLLNVEELDRGLHRNRRLFRSHVKARRKNR